MGSISNLMPPWKPGQSGNPLGRPTAGLTIKEHINSIAASNLTRDEIFEISKNPKEAWSRRVAAIRMVRSVEDPDIADYEDYLGGQINLRELRASGVDTRPIKKIDETERRIPQGRDLDPIIEIERKLELHDRSSADFDRVMDQTVGKPSQQISVDEKKDIQITVNVRPMGVQSAEEIREAALTLVEDIVSGIDPKLLEVVRNDPIPIVWPRNQK